VEIYKKGEGKLTRRVAFYGLLILIVWGFKDLSLWLSRWEVWRHVLVGGFPVPVYEQRLTTGVALCIVLTVVAAYLCFKWLNGPKIGQLLIDTETELRKVAWPSWDDARQSTVIVLIFVAFTAFYLTVVEVVLKKIFDLILI